MQRPSPRGGSQPKRSQAAGPLSAGWVEALAYHGEHRVLLVAGLHAIALELRANPDIRIEPRRILVKMDECLRTTVEDAALLLHQVGEGAQSTQQRFQLIEPRARHMAHATGL